MFKEIKISSIPNNKVSKNGTPLKDVWEFYNLGIEAAEVDTSGYKTALSAWASYHNAVKNAGISVQVMLRKERVFLIRKRV